MWKRDHFYLWSSGFSSVSFFMVLVFSFSPCPFLLVHLYNNKKIHNSTVAVTAVTFFVVFINFLELLSYNSFQLQYFSLIRQHGDSESDDNDDNVDEDKEQEILAKQQQDAVKKGKQEDMWAAFKRDNGMLPSKSSKVHDLKLCKLFK